VTDVELLVGTWVMIAEEVRTAEFHADGTLTHTFDFGRDLKLVLNLTWRMEGNEIVCDQPSDPGEVRATYQFLDPNTLVLVYQGETSTFRRQ
jgi:hypothetical protein